jgi:putative transposase
MSAILYCGVRFPKLMVQHAIWLHVRFTLSLRDVAGLLAERGIIVNL